MSMFPSRSQLLNPVTADEAIPKEDFTYIVTRAQLDAFNTIHEELDDSGLQQKQLAMRLGMNEGQLSRLLGAPGNWGLGTIAKLLWAIRGGRLRFAVEHPMEKAKRNDTAPHWHADVAITASAAAITVESGNPRVW